MDYTVGGASSDALLLPLVLVGLGAGDLPLDLEGLLLELPLLGDEVLVNFLQLLFLGLDFLLLIRSGHARTKQRGPLRIDIIAEEFVSIGLPRRGLILRCL